MRILLLLAALAGSPCPMMAQAPPSDSAQAKSLRALRITVSVGLKSRTDSTIGIKLRLTGSFLFRDFQSLDDIPRLDSIRNNAVLVGSELLIPFGPKVTLRPRLDMGVGVERESRQTVFLIEAAALAEFILPWRRFYFGVLPGIRVNGRSGNELGSEDDQLHGSLQLEARYPAFSIARKPLWVGVYGEVGYFFRGLEFVSVEGSSSEAQQAVEVGLAAGFYDIRPKIWFVRLPRIAVGYRFGSVSGIRIQVGGDWATRVLPR